MSRLTVAASMRLAGDNSILSCTAGSSHHMCAWITILTTFLPPAYYSTEETERAVSNHHNFISDPTHIRLLLILPLFQGIHPDRQIQPPLWKQRGRGCIDNCSLHPGQLTQSSLHRRDCPLILFHTHSNSTEYPAGPHLHQWTWHDQVRDQSPPKLLQCKRACEQYNKSDQTFSSHSLPFYLTGCADSCVPFKPIILRGEREKYHINFKQAEK